MSQIFSDTFETLMLLFFFFFRGPGIRGSEGSISMQRRKISKILSFLYVYIQAESLSNSELLASL